MLEASLNAMYNYGLDLWMMIVMQSNLLVATGPFDVSDDRQSHLFQIDGCYLIIFSLGPSMRSLAEMRDAKTASKPAMKN